MSGSKVVRYKRRPRAVAFIFALVLIYIICFVVLYISNPRFRHMRSIQVLLLIMLYIQLLLYEVRAFIILLIQEILIIIREKTPE